jgi:hypothetical protein
VTPVPGDDSESDRSGPRRPDPLGKRALFWVPPGQGERGDPGVTAAPLGKRALYSAAEATAEDVVPPSLENPMAGRGPVTVECQRCRAVSRISLLDLVLFQFPVGYWLPRGGFDHRMTCPSCRRRAWASLTLRSGT